MNKFIKQLQDSDKRIAIPIMTHPGIEAIGKKVIDAVTDGNVHYQAIRNVTETYHTTACTVIMDLTVFGIFFFRVHVSSNNIASLNNVRRL